jgi:hypothetical protein
LKAFFWIDKVDSLRTQDKINPMASKKFGYKSKFFEHLVQTNGKIA